MNADEPSDMKPATPESLDPTRPPEAPAQSEPGVAPGASPAAAPAAAPGAAADDPLAALKREIDALRDENLRLIAEARNQAVRARREKEEALRYAEADFARDLLVVLDDLERALAAAQKATDATAVTTGVRIVYDHFLKLLAERHIEPIEATGRPFDPNYHEALLRQPHDDVPAGHVIQEVARGFRMHERVIRPARVIVSAGPGGAPAAPEVQEEA